MHNIRMQAKKITLCKTLVFYTTYFFARRQEDMSTLQKYCEATLCILLAFHHLPCRPFAASVDAAADYHDCGMVECGQ